MIDVVKLASTGTELEKLEAIMALVDDAQRKAIEADAAVKEARRAAYEAQSLVSLLYGAAQAKAELPK